MPKEGKRLFFALEVDAPWKEEEPKGRYIAKEFRHITLAFLGDVESKKIESLTKNSPLPSFSMAPVGICDQVLFLPHVHPRVVAYHIHWLDDDCVIDYRKELIAFLKKNEIFMKKAKQFLSHVTLCRYPFQINDWKQHFTKLPLKGTKITLFESLGNSNYQRLWSHLLVEPFEEIEHTADIAFIVKGKNFFELYKNGWIALCFKEPKMVDYFSIPNQLQNIDDVIISLNDRISSMDIEMGSPFKAVSFQSHLKKEEEMLHWEMVVDV